MNCRNCYYREARPIGTEAARTGAWTRLGVPGSTRGPGPRHRAHLAFRGTSTSRLGGLAVLELQLAPRAAARRRAGIGNARGEGARSVVDAGYRDVARVR